MTRDSGASKLRSLLQLNSKSECGAFNLAGIKKGEYSDIKIEFKNQMNNYGLVLGLSGGTSNVTNLSYVVAQKTNTYAMIRFYNDGYKNVDAGQSEWSWIAFKL